MRGGGCCLLRHDGLADVLVYRDGALRPGLEELVGPVQRRPWGLRAVVPGAPEGGEGRCAPPAHQPGALAGADGALLALLLQEAVERRVASPAHDELRKRTKKKKKRIKVWVEPPQLGPVAQLTSLSVSVHYFLWILFYNQGSPFPTPPGSLVERVRVEGAKISNAHDDLFSFLVVRQESLWCAK